MFPIKYTAAVLAYVVALSFSVIAARAEVLSPAGHNFVQESTVGPWNVYADIQRKSCLIEAVDPRGNVVQVGLTSDRNMGYVGVFTQADVGIRNGSNKPITIAVNNHLYTGTAMMRGYGVSNGYTGGYFEANNPNFLADLANGKNLVAFADDGSEGVVIGLDGSRRAIEAAQSCMRKVTGQ